MGTVNPTTRVLDWANFYVQEKKKRTGLEGHISSFSLKEKRPVRFMVTKGKVGRGLEKIIRTFRKRPDNIVEQLETFIRIPSPEEQVVGSYFLSHSNKKVGRVYNDLLAFFSFVEGNTEKIPSQVTPSKKSEITQGLERVTKEWETVFVDVMTKAFSDYVKGSKVTILSDGTLGYEKSGDYRSSKDIFEILEIGDSLQNRILENIGREKAQEVATWGYEQSIKWEGGPQVFSSFAEDVLKKIECAVPGDTTIIRNEINRLLAIEVHRRIEEQVGELDMTEYEIGRDETEKRFALFVTVNGDRTTLPKLAGEISLNYAEKDSEQEKIIRRFVYQALLEQYKKEMGDDKELLKERVKEFCDKEFLSLAKLPSNSADWKKWIWRKVGGHSPSAANRVRRCTTAFKKLDSSYKEMTGYLGAFLLAEGNDVIDPECQEYLRALLKEQFEQRYEELSQVKDGASLLSMLNIQHDRMFQIIQQIQSTIDELGDKRFDVEHAGTLINLLEQNRKACGEMISSQKSVKGDGLTRERKELLQKLEIAQKMHEAAIQVIDARTDRKELEKEAKKRKKEGGSVSYEHATFTINAAQGAQVVAGSVVYGDIINQPHIQTAASVATLQGSSVLSQAMMAGATGALYGFMTVGVPGALTYGVASAGAALARPLFVKLAQSGGLSPAVSNIVGGMAMTAMTHYTNQYLSLYMQEGAKEPVVESQVPIAEPENKAHSVVDLTHLERADLGVQGAMPHQGTGIVEAPLEGTSVSEGCWLCMERVGDEAAKFFQKGADVALAPVYGTLDMASTSLSVLTSTVSTMWMMGVPGLAIQAVPWVMGAYVQNQQLELMRAVRRP